MNNGTVKFFNDTKGFGLNDDIAEGDSVTYEVEEGKKGPNAVNVSVV